MSTPDVQMTGPPAPARPGVTRRALLAGGAVVGVGAVAAACSSKKSSSVSASNGPPTSGQATGTGAPGTSTGGSGGGGGDSKVAMTAASLEVLAVGTYKTVLDAANGQKLGAVPPAVATLVQTALSQHQAALDKWNQVLTSGGGQAVSQPPPDLKTKIDQQVAQVKDAAGAAKVALGLEEIASATYLASIPLIQDKDAITLAGALQVSGQQHAAILLYVLGQYPVPDVFQKTEVAYTSSP